MTTTHVTYKGAVIVGSDAAEVIAELLAALKNLLTLHDNAVYGSKRPTKENINDYYRRVEKMSRAAIARAEGK